VCLTLTSAFWLKRSQPAVTCAKVASISPYPVTPGHSLTVFSHYTLHRPVRVSKLELLAQPSTQHGKHLVLNFSHYNLSSYSFSSNSQPALLRFTPKCHHSYSRFLRMHLLQFYTRQWTHRHRAHLLLYGAHAARCLEPTTTASPQRCWHATTG
jgi:hypothetical protein